MQNTAPIGAGGGGFQKEDLTGFGSLSLKRSEGFHASEAGGVKIGGLRGWGLGLRVYGFRVIPRPRKTETSIYMSAELETALQQWNVNLADLAHEPTGDACNPSSRFRV